eukprot:scaffold45183_cov66-Phaeocystis_antarctica.AAC.1
MIALRLPLIAHQHLARPLRAQPLDGPPLDGQNNAQPRFLTPWEVRSTVSPRVSPSPHPNPSPNPSPSPSPSVSPHPRPDLGLTRRHVRVRGCAPPRRLSHRRTRLGLATSLAWGRAAREVRHSSGVRHLSLLRRTFRAALVAGEAGEDGGYPDAGDLRAGSPTPENEHQLEQQSEQLFEEYQRGGSWVHPTSTPEPGGLLCAMPLQAILMHRLQFAPPGECRWTEALEALLRAELPAEDTVEGADEQRYSKSARWALLERWRASPALTFRLATRMCNEVT